MAHQIDYDALIEAATEARARAYAPYSHFQVGAALLGESGRIYRGCNVENVSYGLTSCAERNAVFGAVMEGERSFRAVAVVTGADTPTAPCGACRQVLIEFAWHGDMDVLLATLGDARTMTTLSAILPL
ncbi:MAG: cytidine deaminase, partial [Chloroflexota bacterium]